jgi:hypothetical protein
LCGIFLRKMGKHRNQTEVQTYKRSHFYRGWKKHKQTLVRLYLKFRTYHAVHKLVDVPRGLIQYWVANTLIPHTIVDNTVGQERLHSRLTCIKVSKER